MPVRFRIASFNAENLFSRAKILNRQDHETTAERLKMAGELNDLIQKPTNFTAADKARIVELYTALKAFISIRENRGGKLFNRAKTQVVAASGKDWDGELEFRREHFSKLSRENTAKVLKAVKADLACMVECEDRIVLNDFNRQLLDSRKFKYAMLIDGNDPRGIDVGALSNFPIREIQTHIYDGPANSRTFSRDCLRLACELPDGRMLHLLCNHFKSKSGGEAASDPRRERQANRVREILEDYNLASDLVVVAGDLNDTPDAHSPLRPLLDVPNLFDVLAEQFPDDPAARWTYHFEANEQIDYLLVSKPLRDALQSAGVERRGIANLASFTDGEEESFDTVTAWTNAASDHGAVWAEFSL